MAPLLAGALVFGSAAAISRTAMAEDGLYETVIGILPVPAVNPFQQKYYVRGITHGAVKE